LINGAGLKRPCRPESNTPNSPSFDDLPVEDDQWPGLKRTLPPGEQHTALPPYLRPTVQHHIQGIPFPCLQMEDELPVAA